MFIVYQEYMKEKVLNAYKNKKMISIYDNSYYPNNFLVAYILCTDDKSYIVYELSPNVWIRLLYV